MQTENNRRWLCFRFSRNTATDAQERVFIYDAENKQVKVLNSEEEIIGEYFYDGDGKRIKKIVPATDEVTVFVYNASGQLVAEYSTETSQTPKVSYTTADHLGSPRILTDENGATISRRDFHPFGEEVFTNQRTAALGYQPDDVRQKFTGYERDGETDLDFAEARYFNSGLGRFSSPDPYNIILEVKSENNREKGIALLLSYLEKVQQWNRYSYVTNNPLLYVDPSGEVLELTGTQAEQDKAFDRILELCGEKCRGRLYIDKRDGRTLVKYFDNKGGLAGNAENIGKVLEDVINSSTLVQLQITNKSTVTSSSGESISLSEKGAQTDIVSSTHIQIFISDAVSMSKISDSQFVLGTRAEDGTKLVNTPTIVLAHEIGHAWGGIVDRTYERHTKTYRVQVWERSNIRSENDWRSLQVENWQRDRLGLKRRATH